jgi:predicted  nucleic acid-binding Zn-ribbon protein
MGDTNEKIATLPNWSKSGVYVTKEIDFLKKDVGDINDNIKDISDDISEIKTTCAARGSKNDYMDSRISEVLESNKKITEKMENFMIDMASYRSDIKNIILINEKLAEKVDCHDKSIIKMETKASFLGFIAGIVSPVIGLIIAKIFGININI